MAAADREIIKALENRRKSMETEWGDYESHYRELRTAILPTRGRFSLGEKRRGTLNKKIIDSAGRKGLRTLKSGLMSGMTSPSRPWFKLGLYDEEAQNDPDVKAWLHVTQQRMYMILRGSNVYRALDACYGDLGLYGTFGGLMRGHFENAIHVHAFPMGRFRAADDEDGVGVAMHWDTEMTVRQMVARFGLDKCSNAVQSQYRSNNLNQTFDVKAAAEVRMERDPMSPMANQKLVGMYYWESKSSQNLLMEGGMDVNGILTPRWEKVEGEFYSPSSPGMDALGDCIQLQGQHRDKAIAIQMSYNPPMQAAAGAKSRMYRAVPGRAHTVSSPNLQQGGFRPTHEVRPDVQALMMDIQDTRSRISESFYEDLFRMTSQFGVEGVKNVTATAIAEMHEEKLIALGPVLESLDHGLLTPIIENTFHYMQKSGIIPPPPEVLDQQAIKIEFISLLAQAQKAIGIATIERTIGFIGTLEQLKPGSSDKLDGDAAIDEFVEQVGPPPKIILTNEQAAQIRQGKAEAAQEQQMLEQAQPLAQAASLISEANERGQQADPLVP